MRLHPPAHFIQVLLLLCACNARSQYNGPESVEYDPVGDRCLISNTGDNTIKQRDQAGTVTPFASVSPAPYGLEIQGDTLFACSGGSVKGYLLSTAAMVFNLNVGGTFLNGITTDGSFLYVTDYDAETIKKVDVAANTYTTLVSSTIFTPNGIVYDPIVDRLVCVSWGSSAVITQVDKNTGAMTPLVTTSLTNIDGITIDCLGNFLVSSWSPDRITRYDPTFTLAPVDLMVPGLNNPADIDFDAVHGRACIPNSGNDGVTLFDLADCTSGLGERDGYRELLVIPNPTTGMVRIAVQLTDPTAFLLLDARGLLIGSGVLPASGLLDVSALAHGRYVVDMPSLRLRAQLVKE